MAWLRVCLFSVVLDFFGRLVRSKFNPLCSCMLFSVIPLCSSGGGGEVLCVHADQGGVQHAGWTEVNGLHHVSTGLDTMLLGVSGNCDDREVTSLPEEVPREPDSEKDTLTEWRKREFIVCHTQTYFKINE